MGDYSARYNLQSVSHEAMQGSVRLIGGRLTLPYNHPPHSSLGSAQEEDLPETLYGIPRDLEPYNQTVIGTNTLTIQTLETSRTLRTQITQFAAAAEVFEETYRLLNRLQATTQQLAEARPSPEYARAVWRNRRWVQKYQEFLNKPPGAAWAFPGPTMPTFTIPIPHDVTPSAPFTPGATLSPREGISYHLGTAPYSHVVHERTVYTYSLPRSSRTQLPREIDEFPGAQVMSHLYQLNEIFPALSRPSM